jgi:hypothetical protein
MKPRKKLDPTKLRRRREPPTLEEAVFAAQGLTVDCEQQVVIAACLIGLPEEEVRANVQQTRAGASTTLRPTGSRRTVIVEHRGSRASLPKRQRKDQ